MGQGVGVGGSAMVLLILIGCEGCGVGGGISSGGWAVDEGLGFAEGELADDPMVILGSQVVNSQLRLLFLNLARDIRQYSSCFVRMLESIFGHCQKGFGG